MEDPDVVNVLDLLRGDGQPGQVLAVRIEAPADGGGWQVTVDHDPSRLTAGQAAALLWYAAANLHRAARARV